MLEKLAKLDESLFIYLNNLGTKNWDKFWLTFTELPTHVPMMLILGFILYKVLGTRKFLIALLVIAVMATISDQFTNLAKHTFERPRPCRVPELKNLIRYIAVRCGPFGYFSGHSATSMAIAVIIGSLLKSKYPVLLPLLVFWAFCMGYSRVYIGVHYPADLLTGYTVGALTGIGFYKIYQFLIRKYVLY